MIATRPFLLSAASLAAASSAFAHHSAAMFDTTVEVVLEGTITEVEWKNPHVYMTVGVTGPEGQPTEQELELGSPSTMVPMGLSPDSLRVGEHVKVRARPSRRGPGHTMLAVDATMADGSVLPLNVAARSSRLPSEEVATSIAGRWVAQPRGFVGIADARFSWPLTEKGRQVAMTRDEYATKTTHLDCIPYPAPTLMFRPVLRTVEIGEETVVIDLDWLGARRIIHLNEADHPANVERTAHGHSVGHWESDALVVDTIAFAQHAEGLLQGLPNGPRKHLVERFALSEDHRHLDYSFVLEDPDYLARPMNYSGQWDYRPTLEPSGAACDVGVARRFLEEQ